MVILFDIDGTLIDHDAAEAAAVDALYGRVGHTLDAAGFLQIWRAAFDRNYRRYLAGELSIQEQRRERFREVFDPMLSDKTADQLSASYIKEYLAACRLYPDVEAALAQVAGYRMGIISNAERTQQHHKLVQTGIARFFGPMILSAECGMAKPARGIFELACESMGVPPSQAMYVGDRRDVDAEGARRAGLHGIWLDRLGECNDRDAGWRIESLAELPEVVARIGSCGENRTS